MSHTPVESRGSFVPDFEQVEVVDRQPYDYVRVEVDQAGSLGLPPTTNPVNYYRYNNRGAESISQAAAEFAEHGAAVLDRDVVLPEPHAGETIWDAIGPVIPSTLRAIAAFRDSYVPNPDGSGMVQVLAPRQYTEATYNTTRRLSTIAPDMVTKYLPEVAALQHKLLGLVRAVANDPTIEVSVDPAEATVINVQRFNLNGDLSDFQQHGAHADRVDRTLVVGLDNLGERGELVVVDNYAEACEALRLDPDGDFNGNMAEILSSHLKETITFKAHRISTGTTVLLKSTDYHFITAKGLGAVLDAIEQGEAPYFIDPAEDDIIGRAIINMAFESQECRNLHESAQILMDRFSLHRVGNRERFFHRLDTAVEHFRATFEGSDAERDRLASLVRRAIITKGTANRLYGKEKAENPRIYQQVVASLTGLIHDFVTRPGSRHQRR